MRIITGSVHPSLASDVAKILRVPLVPVDIHVFPDGEKRVRIRQEVLEEHVVVVQPTVPPVDSAYMELFFLIDAAKRSGAAFVTAVVPYLGYQRQDHVFVSGETVSLSVVATMLKALKLSKLIVFDLHSIKIPELFAIPLSHLSALSLFADIIKERGWVRESVLVSPDMGGIRRIKQLSALLGNMPYASIEKNRDLATGAVSADILHGEVFARALIVDDIISSGRTVETAAALLKERGAKEIYVFATHPVFSNEAPHVLQNAPVEKVFVTNTIDVIQEKRFEKLEIRSIAGLIAKELRA